MKHNDRAFPFSYTINETDMMGFKHLAFHHQEGMSLHQYAAIKLRVPRSGDPDIDAMIRESRRAEFAGQALTGAIISGADECLSEDAYRIADAMLAEWEKENNV